MTITLNGDTGITTPMYNGTISANTVTPSVNMKNRIINGAMVIDQRNAGAATANTINSYTLDRWYVTQSVSGKVIVQQNAGSVTPPVGFKNYLGITSQSAYSLGADDYYLLAQFIEGYNIADLGWGTANAKTVTLSFWVYSSLTGTFGGALTNGDLNRSYPFTYTISSANTWTQASVTITGDTSGTWFTTNSAGFKVWFGLGVGTTYSGTAGSWSGNLYFNATGATSVVGTNGATFYITGVQLEVGSSATSFDYRPYGTELALCQRYYQLATRSEEFLVGACISTSAARTSVQLTQEMRTAPTITLATSGSSANQIAFLTTAGNYPSTIGTLSAGGSTVNGFYITGTGNTASGWAAGAGTWMYASSANTKVYTASAEL